MSEILLTPVPESMPEESAREAGAWPELGTILLENSPALIEPQSDALEATMKGDSDREAAGDPTNSP